jgi:DNA segregation ATPase FtsK/SpoIIIE, S-DNA-T family
LSDLAGPDRAAPGRPEAPVPEVDIPGNARATTAAGPLALLGPSDDEALTALAIAHPDLVAVVDDAELFLDTPVERPLLEIARSAEASGGGVLCAGTTAELASMFRGLTVEVRKHRLGVLLHPGRYGDVDLFAIRAPVGGDLVPGRGVFIDGVDVTPVQVALPG